jgi:hypothetical protein
VALARLKRRQSHDKRLAYITPLETALELARMKQWKEPEAFTYCTACADYCYAPDNWRHYIDAVRENSQLRSFYALGEFVEIGAQLRYRVLQPDADPNHLASAVRECVDSILRDGWADTKAIFERTK